MGRKKNWIYEGLREGEEIKREAIEEAEELEVDGSEIKALLDEIGPMDDDDDLVLENVELEYRDDFKSAFEERVETKAVEVEKILDEVSDSASEELENVNDAEDKFNQMAEITDVGRHNAEKAADAMRDSAAEYEAAISEAEAIVEETRSEVDTKGSSLESMFG